MLSHLPIDGRALGNEMSKDAVAILFGGREKVFAILDAGCIVGLTNMMENEGLHFVSLSSGELAEEAADTAPYLVEMTPTSRRLRALLTSTGTGEPRAGSLWGAQAGEFSRSRATLTQMRSHLRLFMRVMDANNHPYFLRF